MKLKPQTHRSQMLSNKCNPMMLGAVRALAALGVLIFLNLKTKLIAIIYPFNRSQIL